MVYIYYTCFTKKLPDKLWIRYFEELPVELQAKTKKFIFWNDQHAHLFGKLLLKHAWNKLSGNGDVLNNLKYNDYNRPFIDGNIDFNISHSGEYVVCAIVKNSRLGIDIEHIREINLNDFRNVMTKEQWKDIYSSDDKYRKFFDYWSIKESVIKADSRGLLIPLLDIHVSDDESVNYEASTWYINKLSIAYNYSAHFVSDNNNIPYKLHEIDFNNYEH